jgi:hypothetical protein
MRNTADRTRFYARRFIESNKQLLVNACDPSCMVIIHSHIEEQLRDGLLLFLE